MDIKVDKSKKVNEKNPINKIKDLNKKLTSYETDIKPINKFLPKK